MPRARSRPSQFRLGIIGAGHRGIVCFGDLFSRRFGRQTRIVALADPNLERAKAGLGALAVPADIHEDPQELISRKDIDAVVITVPDYLHGELAVAAFRRGKHVLIDKPLAITGRGCLRVMEAADTAGTLLYVGFNLRHIAVMRRLKALVDAGTLGAIFSIQAIEHYDVGRTYMARWNRLKKFSGGLFIHKGTHDFDGINWLMGRARPVRVGCFGNVFTLNKRGLPFQIRKGVEPGPTCSSCPYAVQCPDCYTMNDVAERLESEVAAAYRRMWTESCAARDGYHRDLCTYLSDKDTHDQAIAIIEYDNGATASHSEYFVTPITNRRYLVEGTLGHGELDLHESTITVQPRWSQRSIMHRVKRGADAHYGADGRMCANFIECLKGHERPAATGADAAWSVAIGEACEIARAEHRTVEIKEVLNVRHPLLRRGKEASAGSARKVRPHLVHVLSLRAKRSKLSTRKPMDSSSVLRT